MAKTEAITARETSSQTANHRPTEDEIAIRAHEIFLERGAAPGHDLDDWLQAELELSKKRTNGVPTHALAAR
jgi:hypothetical protein